MAIAAPSKARRADAGSPAAVGGGEAGTRRSRRRCPGEPRAKARARRDRAGYEARENDVVLAASPLILARRLEGSSGSFFLSGGSLDEIAWRA
jgi:hypothetical protein